MTESTTIIHEGPANLYRGMEGVGGRLFLTVEYLLFEPHMLNIQKGKEIIYLAEINEINRSKSLGIIPNSLSIRTGKNEYKFVVSNREVWFEKISEHIHKLNCSQ